MALEVVWSGSDKHVYLCVASEHRRDLGYVRPAKLPSLRFRNLYREREILLTVLATKARWKVTDLRLAVGLDVPTLGGLLKRLERSGLISRVCYGTVRLNPSAKVSR